MHHYLLRTAVILLTSALLLTGCHNDSHPDTLESGLQTIKSGGVDREFFLALPGDGAGIAAAALEDDTRPPLLLAFHGYTGSYTNWVGPGRVYDLVDVVDEDAVFVAPQALDDASGNAVWGGEADLNLFVDIVNYLTEHGVEFNPNKILLAGHSNGAGFAHELGCRYGNIIRGIVTAAGSLVSTDCFGSAAVLMMQGSNDPLTAGFLAEAGLNYWILYNGWDPDASVPAGVGPCEDYSFPGEPNSPYPVLWCEHTQGHSWPDYGSQTAWDFLNSLDVVEPTLDYPAGGGAERATPPSDALMTFRIDVPAEINRPIRGVATLRPVSWLDMETCSAPDVILGIFGVDGVLIPGQISELIEFPITYLDFSGKLVFPADWALNVTIYVEGGSASTIPTPGVDYAGNILVSLSAKNADVFIDDPIPLTPGNDPCGFGG
jgi:polyhydroxybutyrate depolymerase